NSPPDSTWPASFVLQARGIPAFRVPRNAWVASWVGQKQARDESKDLRPFTRLATDSTRRHFPPILNHDLKPIPIVSSQVSLSVSCPAGSARAGDEWLGSNCARLQPDCGLRRQLIRRRQRTACHGRPVLSQ